jgi:uncharacterized membrane protein
MYKLDKLKNNSEDKLGIILFIIGIIFLIITTYIGLTKIGLWYDEFYSIAISKLSVSEIIDLGPRDVHPLLYYFIFKGFLKIFTFLDAAVVGKIVSLVPIYLIGLLSITKVRKNFGYLTAGIFFLCITTMPQLMIYSVEIRMYTWGLFFVTASFIYMYEICKNPNLKNWSILTFLTICSAYTHYFSAIASFGIYLVLLIYLIKNNKEQLKNWFISAIISVIAFLPWIFVVLGQIATFKEDYWIAPITFNTLVSYVYFILSPAEVFIPANELVSPTILGSIMLILFAYLVYKVRDKYAIEGILVFITVPIIGVLTSIIVNPFFHQRFLIPAVGCLWLSFSVLLSKIYENKKIFYIILCVILIVGVIGCVNFINIQTQDANDTQTELDSLNNVVGSGNIIFHDFFPTYFEIEGYMLENNHHLCNIENISSYINESLNDPGVKAEIDSGSKVYYIDGGYENIEELKKAGFIVEEVKFDQTIKNNKFKIYEIKI